MFNNLSSRLSDSFRKLRGKGIISESDINETTAEIRRALLDADVALPVVREFTAQVREKARGALVTQGLNPGQQIVRIVHDELVEILGGETRQLHFAQRGPTVFMLAGLQGAGKTTLAGKLGHWMREEGKRVLLVASDLQRPNAVTQLQVVGQRAGVEVWAPEPGNGVGNPVQVARSGVNHAIENGYDLVIVDTAGRLGVDEEMMQQARDIRDAVNPHEILFVLDAMVGQDAVHTSVAFRDGVGFTGVVLSKLDGDARGGAALSVRGVTGQPILFASTGEGLEDFERFHPDRMAGRILDMGDILTLIEQAEKKIDQQEAEAAAQKALSGELTLEDFLGQLQQIRKLGSLKKLVGMMPGIGQYRDQLDMLDDSQIDRIEAIIHSMTPAERRDVRILNGSRRARIARGAGVSVAQINTFVKNFEAMREMTKRMGAGGVMPGMGGFPGMGNLPGTGKRAGARQPKKVKKKSKSKVSGNPAKRRQQELQAMLPREQRHGAAFGLPQDGPKPTLDDLPDDIKRMLGGR